MHNRKNTKDCEINAGMKQNLLKGKLLEEGSLQPPPDSGLETGTLALEGVSCFQKGEYFQILYIIYIYYFMKIFKGENYGGFWL